MRELFERKRLCLLEGRPIGRTDVETELHQPLGPIAGLEAATYLLLVHPLCGVREFVEGHSGRPGRLSGTGSPGAEGMTRWGLENQLRRHCDRGMTASVHELVRAFSGLRKRIRRIVGQSAEGRVVHREAVRGNRWAHASGGPSTRRNTVGTQAFGQLQVGVQTLFPHPAPTQRPQQVTSRRQRQFVGRPPDKAGHPGEGVAAEEYPYPGSRAIGVQGLQQPQAEFDLTQERGSRRRVLFRPWLEIVGKLPIPAAAVTHRLLRSPARWAR